MDLSILDLDIPFGLTYTVGATISCYADLTVLAVVTWQVLFVAIPVVYVVIRLQVMNRFIFELFCNNEMVPPILINFHITKPYIYIYIYDPHSLED